MEKIYHLAAEMFGYSYEHYSENLEMRLIRFTKYMPDDIKILQDNERKNYSDSELADMLEIDIDLVQNYKDKYEKAKRIVNAKHAAESFMISVKESIRFSIDKGLSEDEDIDKLLVQIGYNVVDFGFLLDKEEKEIKDYNDYLKQG